MGITWGAILGIAAAPERLFFRAKALSDGFGARADQSQPIGCVPIATSS